MPNFLIAFFPFLLKGSKPCIFNIIFSKKIFSSTLSNPVSEKLPFWINIALNFGDSVHRDANSHQTYVKILTRCPLLLFDVAREKDNFPDRNCRSQKNQRKYFQWKKKEHITFVITSFLLTIRSIKTKIMAKLVILIPLTVNNTSDIKLAIIEPDQISASWLTQMGFSWTNPSFLIFVIVYFPTLSPPYSSPYSLILPSKCPVTSL